MHKRIANAINGYRPANTEPAKRLTQSGMTKSVSAVGSNAPLSIRCSFERESNVTNACELQDEKHNSQIIYSDSRI
jgi:hypothetical protein